MKRLVVNVTDEKHSEIKTISRMLNKSITDYVLDLIDEDLKNKEEKLKKFKELFQ